MNDLRTKYLDATKGLYCPWAEIPPRKRFAEYDEWRAIWVEELRAWLYGGNPRQVGSLTQLAWKVQHDRIGEGGRRFYCLNWSDRSQRVYLGDGLIEYLGVLKDEVERMNGEKEGGE